jgi:hypothetical protein
MVNGRAFLLALVMVGVFYVCRAVIILALVSLPAILFYVGVN